MESDGTDRRYRREVASPRLRRVAAVFVGGATLLAATGGAASAATRKPSPQPTKAQLAMTCTRIADVLSDGPDPGADPVGYALAQVRPLREIATDDETLKKDIEALASAYETVYKTNDKKGTQAAVQKAGKMIDKTCPGAF